MLCLVDMGIFRRFRKTMDVIMLCNVVECTSALRHGSKAGIRLYFNESHPLEV